MLTEEGDWTNRASNWPNPPQHTERSNAPRDDRTRSLSLGHLPELMHSAEPDQTTAVASRTLLDRGLGGPVDSVSIQFSMNWRHFPEDS